MFQSSETQFYDRLCGQTLPSQKTQSGRQSASKANNSPGSDANYRHRFGPEAKEHSCCEALSHSGDLAEVS